MLLNLFRNLRDRALSFQCPVKAARNARKPTNLAGPVRPPEQPQAPAPATAKPATPAPATAKPAGQVRGQHFSHWQDEVLELAKRGDTAAALALLEECMGAAEAEAGDKGGKLAFWYYERAAIIHRAAKDPAAEVAVLERFGAHSPGGLDDSAKLRNRMARARELLAASE